LMAKQPAQRFQTADELATFIDLMLQGMNPPPPSGAPGTPPPPSPPPQASTSTQRRTMQLRKPFAD
jgi:hypothetical protein